MDEWFYRIDDLKQFLNKPKKYFMT
jgi:hypothetical protein